MSRRKVYYQPNGGKSAIPDVQDLCELFVFNSPTPDAYNQNNVFLKTNSASTIFLNEVKRIDPDVIIIETLNLDMLRTLIQVRKQYKKPIILFWGDLLNQNSYPLIMRIAAYIDLALILDTNSEKKLQRSGLPIKYTVFPTSGRLYHPDPKQQKIYNYVFAGNLPLSSQWYYQIPSINFRLELVRAFSEKPGFALFGGKSWKDYGINVRGWVDEFQLSMIYNQARIVLASDQIIKANGFTSNRTTKALMSGAFLLIKKFEGIDRIFENHRQLVWFDSVSEAIELADYYIAHEDERETIAHEGMVWARDHADIRVHFNNWCDTKVARNYNDMAVRGFSDYLWRIRYLVRRILIRLGGQLKVLSPEWFWMVK